MTSNNENKFLIRLGTNGLRKIYSGYKVEELTNRGLAILEVQFSSDLKISVAEEIISFSARQVSRGPLLLLPNKQLPLPFDSLKKLTKGPGSFIVPFYVLN